MILYKHSKSGNIYELITQATHSETGEVLIVYQTFPKTDKCVLRAWARPANNFFSTVIDENGNHVDRFVKIENYEDIFTADEIDQMKLALNGKCDDGTVMRNADYFQKILNL